MGIYLRTYFGDVVNPGIRRNFRRVCCKPTVLWTVLRSLSGHHWKEATLGVKRLPGCNLC